MDNIPPESTTDVFGPERFMRTVDNGGCLPPHIRVQPSLNGDSHGQGGHWPQY